jgi:serine/threonine protein kinase/Rieske Fe-S protein
MQKHDVSVDELVGQTLGTCHVEQLLGRNRLSTIYLAQQPEQNRTVAITLFMIPEQFSLKARVRFISRFTSQAAALVLLDHPHILPIYEYGDRFGYPYLVTPYVTDGSLANLLKQQKRCSPASTLEILTQVAAGLDYAYSRGAIHGALKPSHILLRNAQAVQVAGFGLTQMLEMRGIDPDAHPHTELAHLLSVAGTFLGAPEYIAPECVVGQPADARSDIYSLGIILFEMLSGKLAFSGADPFEVAMQHVEQPIPSLHALCPDISSDLEQVISRALQPDPTQRFQYASELVNAFAQALQQVPQTSTATTPDTAQEAEATHLPAASIQNEQTTSTAKWQLVPPIITGRLPAVHASMSEALPIDPETQSTPSIRTWQFVPPIVTGRLPAIDLPSTPPASGFEEDVSLQTVPAGASEEIDTPSLTPAGEQSSTFSAQIETQAPLHSEESASIHAIDLQPETSRPRRRPSTRKPKYVTMTRRQAVALLATGGIAAVGAITVGGISLAHLLGNNAHPQNPTGNTGTTPTYGPRPPHATPGHPGTTPTAGKPTPNPTAKAAPSPPGTVIGNTDQPLNSAVNFSNPVDEEASLLIHLPSNSFVAYESACTHEGVPVQYDPGTQTLICPAHFSIFDPANGGKVIQGPAARPLPAVTIHVNADGTIITG